MTRTDKKKQIDKFKMRDIPQDTDPISAINAGERWRGSKDRSVLKETRKPSAAQGLTQTQTLTNHEKSFLDKWENTAISLSLINNKEVLLIF